MEMNLRTN